MATSNRSTGEALLFLTDEQLRQGIEAMFFAYRGFTADPDRTTVNNLLHILGVTKQSLNRVLRSLIEDGLVEVQVGQKDRRERHLYLTETGQSLEQELSNAQRARMRSAYRDVGADAVSGFRQVLEAMMDPEMKRAYWKLRDNEGMDK